MAFTIDKVRPTLPSGFNSTKAFISETNISKGRVVGELSCAGGSSILMKAVR